MIWLDLGWGGCSASRSNVGITKDGTGKEISGMFAEVVDVSLG
jgi:hypothetical protein